MAYWRNEPVLFRRRDEHASQADRRLMGPFNAAALQAIAQAADAARADHEASRSAEPLIVDLES
jgi:hypothetical protein